LWVSFLRVRNRKTASAASTICRGLYKLTRQPTKKFETF
jgi:hypothetical protein